MNQGETPQAVSGASTFALAIRRPVGVAMIVLGVVIFGAVAYTRLELALLPRFTHPTLTVRTAFPGAAPEEVEQFLTIPLEKQLSIVSGLTELRSLSRAGMSEVVLEFQWDTPLPSAALEVREKLDRLVLPEESESPQLLRFAPEDEPILRLALVQRSGRGADPKESNEDFTALSTLHQWAEEFLKPPLLALPGVAAVSVRGGADPEVVVELDEGRLSRLGLSVTQVAERLEAEHVNLPGGVLAEGPLEYRVRTLNELDTLEALRQVLVSGRGRPPVRLRDVARIAVQPGEAQVLTRIDGLPAVELEVFKEADANVVDIAARVRDRLWGAPEGMRRLGAPRSIQENMPAGRRIELVHDQSRFIRAALAEVRRTALLGGVLAVAVLLLFLGRLRATLFVLAALPLSILATFLPMFLGGVSLNLISMGGLALGVGMLVDNSIVVLEAIHRLREQGKTPFDAALQGVGEVGGAVTASTFTTAAVFFPMVFVEGVAGQIIGDLALTVVFSLVASLLVAVWVLPMLTVALEPAPRGGPSPLPLHRRFLPVMRESARGRIREFLVMLDGPPLWLPLIFPLRLLRWLVVTGPWAVILLLSLPLILLLMVLGAGGSRVRILFIPLELLLDAFRRGMTRVVATYRRVLVVVLRNPGWVVMVGLASLPVAFWGAASLPQALMPPLHQGVLRVSMELPPGRSLETTAGRAAEIEHKLAGLPGIIGTFVRIGHDPEDTSPKPGGSHTASIWTTLATHPRPARAEAEATVRIRQALADEPEIKWTIEPPKLLTIKSPLTVEVQGEDLKKIEGVAFRLRKALSSEPRLTEVTSWQQPGSPEVQIRFNRDRLALYGLSARSVAERIRAKLEGETPVRYRVQGRRVDVRVRIRRPQLDTLEELASLVINPGQAVTIPLRAVAELSEGEGPTEIRRIAQRRTALITADVAQGGLGEAREAIAALVARQPTPPGVTVHLGGQGGELAQSLSSLALALGLAVFLVYLVLASQFESFLAPLVILLAVPLAGIGVVAGLWAAGQGLNVMVGLGLIVLVGIVVNNAIVLVATVLRFRRSGMPMDEAIVEAGAVRLRPILMTTLTTVLGLLPLVVGGGEGAELRAPIALTLISGLAASMVLTLVVIPAACRLLPGGGKA